VLSSGFLENALRDVFSRYARACSNPEVADFVDSRLSAIQNPKASKFVETAGAFNKVWVVDLETFISAEGRKETIDAIISNRHLIAHGKDAGITLVSVKDYLAKSVQVIEHLENTCGLEEVQ
jgi:predicted nucleic-acid-binding protein